MEYGQWDKDLPVLLISGDRDPMGGAGKGVTLIYRQMTKAGMKNVTLKLIPGGRHAILMGNAEEAERIIGGMVREWSDMV